MRAGIRMSVDIGATGRWKRGLAKVAKGLTGSALIGVATPEQKT
jgi:hypothetical protein